MQHYVDLKKYLLFQIDVVRMCYCQNSGNNYFAGCTRLYTFENNCITFQFSHVNHFEAI